MSKPTRISEESRIYTWQRENQRKIRIVAGFTDVYYCAGYADLIMTGWRILWESRDSYGVCKSAFLVAPWRNIRHIQIVKKKIIIISYPSFFESKRWERFPWLMTKFSFDEWTTRNAANCEGVRNLITLCAHEDSHKMKKKKKNRISWMATCVILTIMLDGALNARACASPIMSYPMHEIRWKQDIFGVSLVMPETLVITISRYTIMTHAHSFSL